MQIDTLLVIMLTNSIQVKYHCLQKGQSFLSVFIQNNEKWVSLKKIQLK